MRRTGRPPRWTADEREQVLALAEQGVTQRAIAQQVFGHARYRGRVQRIVGSPPRRALPQDVAQPRRRAENVSDILANLGEPPDLRQLIAGMVVRQWRDLAARGDLPSLDLIEPELEARGFGSIPTT